MALRSAHGAGRGALLRCETLPPDEQPPATPAETDRPDRDANGRFVPGNRSAAARRVRPGKLGGVDTSAPEFRPFARWGQRYAAHRRGELARAHGGSISAGVGALIESAARMLAASRWLDSQAKRELNADTFKRAADLAAQARQTELTAWELASREVAARPKENRTQSVLAKLRGDG